METNINNYIRSIFKKKLTYSCHIFSQTSLLGLQSTPTASHPNKCTEYELKHYDGVGDHPPFQHNGLFHLPYMAVAEISLRISLRVIPEEPFLLLKYIITLSLILCPYY